MRVQYCLLIILFSLIVTSCEKEKKEIIENPKPTEPELITTVRVKATKADNSNDVKTFSYKVENGFHSIQNNFQVDTIFLEHSSVYNIEIFVLDEKSTPSIDVTAEIIEERNSHLFYYMSTPEEGAGSISVSDRDKDKNGQDFARVCRWQTGLLGAGKLNIVLIHGPRNKEAANRDLIGGATDADVIFPVVLY